MLVLLLLPPPLRLCRHCARLWVSFREFAASTLLCLCLTDARSHLRCTCKMLQAFAMVGIAGASKDGLPVVQQGGRLRGRRSPLSVYELVGVACCVIACLRGANHAILLLLRAVAPSMELRASKPPLRQRKLVPPSSDWCRAHIK